MRQSDVVTQDSRDPRTNREYEEFRAAVALEVQAGNARARKPGGYSQGGGVELFDPPQMSDAAFKRRLSRLIAKRAIEGKDWRLVMCGNGSGGRGSRPAKFTPSSGMPILPGILSSNRTRITKNCGPGSRRPPNALSSPTGGERWMVRPCGAGSGSAGRLTGRQKRTRVTQQ